MWQVITCFFLFLMLQHQVFLLSKKLSLQDDIIIQKQGDLVKSQNANLEKKSQNNHKNRIKVR